MKREKLLDVSGRCNVIELFMFIDDGDG